MPARGKRNWQLPPAFVPYFPARDVIWDSGAAYPGIREIKRAHSPRKVFLDIPYDAEFIRALLPAVVTSCWAFDLQPFRLSEDAVGPRLRRLADHLLQSHFVVCDLSREERMNMPFELGMAIGQGRSCAILVDDQRRLLRNFSDLAGLDLLVHDNNRGSLIRQLCNWFADQFRRRRWPIKTLRVDRLISVVEPTIREFVVENGNHLALEDQRRALTEYWKTVNVDYLQECADARGLPLEEKVAQHRIATLRDFFRLER